MSRVGEIEKRLRSFLSADFAKVLAPIHDYISSTIAKGHLECSRCHRRASLSTDLVTNYLQHGWPTCCGSTMVHFGPTPGGGQ